ncbi:hypothetical protein CHELA1G11_14745 [Hyphomicrobiales bacterium]|nr:hypothetical protein CHELA1G2_14360 [Hyphomicrobiales bacterium]CAH1680631.1 hypothetical protein CHELA1G11_14745 [Hyphomicrobiales bacterium]
MVLVPLWRSRVKRAARMSGGVGRERSRGTVDEASRETLVARLVATRRDQVMHGSV